MKGKFLRRTAVMVKINGKMVDLCAARIVYKCAACLGDLKIVNSGLKCQGNPEHRNFIHRAEVEKLLKQQAQNIENLNQFYEIVDGKVVIKQWQS